MNGERRHIGALAKFCTDLATRISTGISVDAVDTRTLGQVAVALEDLRTDLDVRDQDMREAAGELMVPLPEPGSDLGKVVSANSILRQQRDRLEDDVRSWRDRARAAEAYIALIPEAVLTGQRREAYEAWRDIRDEAEVCGGDDEE